MTDTLKDGARVRKEVSCNTRTDLVDRCVRDLTAEETVDWLIECHGLNESSKETVVMNLREQYRHHELRGRLWRGGVLATIVAEWLELRYRRFDQRISMLEKQQKKPK